MRIRFGSPLVALSLATLMTGLFAGCERELGVRGDPRVEGVVPHVFPDADPYILGDPKAPRPIPGRPVTPTPTPTPTPTTSTKPTTTTGPETGGPEAPATTTAPEAGTVKADFSTPKNTAKSIYAIFASGKPRDAKICFAEPANDAEKDLLETGWSDEFTVYPMYAALAEKFPDQIGKAIPDLSKPIEFMKNSIESLTEEINGDKATLKSTAAGVSGPIAQPINFVKVDKDWKIVIEPGRFLTTHNDNQKAMSKATEEMITTLTTDIKAGKYATMDDVKKDMDAKRAELINKFAPATTGPGGPSSAPGGGGPPPG